MPPRIYYRNVLTSPGAFLIPSSEERSFPRAALLRPGLSDVLRFGRGWGIRSGENDHLQIDEQDPDPPNAWQTIAANLSAGQYGTPALVGSEVGLKLSAAAGAFNGYAVTYGGGKFTIAPSASPISSCRSRRVRSSRARSIQILASPTRTWRASRATRPAVRRS